MTIFPRRNIFAYGIILCVPLPAVAPVMLQCLMTPDAPTAPTRRHFLKAAPLAAATLALPSTLRAASPASQAATPSVGGEAPLTFQVVSASTLESTITQLKATPGVKDLFPAKTLPMVMNVTVESAKAAAEFEYHEHRDHIFQVVDGRTRYELGGTPRDPRQTKPGEWLAKASDGFKTVELAKGDLLMIPRMTPHRRITETQVTLFLTNVVDPATQSS